MKTVVFICRENSNRSQMAEAFARRKGAGVLEAHSAGSKPSGRINPRAITMMAEKDYELTDHCSKSTQDLPYQSFDYVITMGCGDVCPWIAGSERDDWGLEDPRDLSDEGYRRIRDQIEEKVTALVERAQRAGA
jgi:arsenate reductase (thioredoxin)